MTGQALPGVPPTISVAMCTYNGARYLGEQIHSIAAQTRLPMELVVCDDRSSDETLSLLHAFAKDAPFPVHIHENVASLGSTRNFNQAIRLCLGDYVALCDQDDRWRQDKLERLGGILDHDLSASLVFSDATLIDAASLPTGETLWKSFRFSGLSRDVFRRDPGRVLLERPVVTGATMIFRRSLLSWFSDIPEGWVHDGWITWMSVLFGRPVFLDDVLTDYRLHASQQLGVGQTSMLGRVRAIRRRHQTLYATMAAELKQLEQFLQKTSPDVRRRWIGRVQEATTFFHARAAAGTGVRRIRFLLRYRRAYRSLSGSMWRALLRDLLMGRSST